jgi:hypothetical protein
VSVLEKKIDQRIVALFKKRWPDGICIKLGMVGAYGTAGWPDRMFVVNGRVVLIEVKAPGKKPTALQARRIEQLRFAGLKVACFDDAGPAYQWLVDVLEWSP